MKALILAGGFSTRLRPLSCTRPKSLFPIVNKPLQERIFERLISADVDETILAVSYRTEALLKQCRVRRHGMQVKYSRDPLRKPLGTGGAVRKAMGLLSQESAFLVLNEDIFTDLDYSEILRTHRAKNPVATIALHSVQDPSRFGVAELGKDNRIKRFIEKPEMGKASAAMANAGVYILSSRIFDYIPVGRKVSLEREVFPKLATEGQLCGHVFAGWWADIGKPEDYLEINKTILTSERHPLSQRNTRSSTVKMPVALDKGVKLGKESIIGPYAVLGRNVKTGSDVHIDNSVVFRETCISDSSSVSGAIIGEGVFIGKRVTIRKGCVIGDHVRIGDNVTLAQSVSVCPGKEVSVSVASAGCVY